MTFAVISSFRKPGYGIAPLLNISQTRIPKLQTSDDFENTERFKTYNWVKNASF